MVSLSSLGSLFGSKNKKDFRHQGIKYEHENSGWRGMFLCSAFVVEATIPGLE